MPPTVSGGKAKEQTEKGIAMTLDCNARYCSIEPRLGTALSVAEAFRNITAVGARPIGMSNCLNFGSPEKPEGMYSIAESIRGLSDAARAFSAPVISGNVSLYNESINSAILPTPLIALVGLMDDASKAVPAHFQAEGDCILLLGSTDEGDIGGSEYLAQCCNIEHGALPALQYDLELNTAACVRSLIAAGLLVSCHDLSSGGLAVSLAESCFARYQSIGATLEVSETFNRPDLYIFAETGARYLLSCTPDNKAAVKEAIVAAGLPIAAEGIVGGETINISGIASLALKDAYDAWLTGLEPLF
jgi:phosphoribosylformylglycinamidine synthase